MKAPSAVHLQLNRADIAGLERQGDALTISLTSGDVLRLPDFYVAGADGMTSDLVLHEANGRTWLARAGAHPDFAELANDDDDTAPSSALALDPGGAGSAAAAGSKGGGGFLLPGLGLLGGGGLAAAAGGGGGGGSAGGGTPTPVPSDNGSGGSGNGAGGGGSGGSGSGGGGSGGGGTGGSGSDGSGTGGDGSGGSGTGGNGSGGTGGDGSDGSGTGGDGSGGSGTGGDDSDGSDTGGDGSGGSGTGGDDSDGSDTGGDGSGGSGTGGDGSDGSGTGGDGSGGSGTGGDGSGTGGDGSGDSGTDPDPGDPDPGDPPSAPSAPTAQIDGATGATVTGTGVPGATIIVRGADGQSVLGTGTAGSDGAYSVAIPPQTNGETLSVVQTVAGLASPPATLVAPDFFIAHDDIAHAGLDLVPAGTHVDKGTATYVALLSLAAIDPQLDLAGLSLLGVQPVAFTVGAGHSFEARFDYGGLLDIGAVANYQIVVQQLVGGQWVGLDGTDPYTLLDLHALNGDLTATRTLDGGDYRAFATFDGLLGLGVLGTLEVSGMDIDHGTIAAIDQLDTHGNLITDADGAGNADLAPAGTVLHSITVDGVVTLVEEDDTLVRGAHGTLVVDRDGSYRYTPDADAVHIGAAEVFTYTLARPGGAQESARLVIEIGSPDASLVWGAPGDPAATGLAAADDAATASVVYENRVETVSTGLFTLHNGIGLIFPSIDNKTATFTVAADTVSDIRIVIDASQGLALSVLPSYIIMLQDADGNIVGLPTTVQAVANLLGLGAGAVAAYDDLPPGDYSVTVSSMNSLGLGYDSIVSLRQEVTHLTEFEVGALTGADGNLLANDSAGSDFTAILVDKGAGFEAVGNGGATLTGAHGTLTLDAAGNYHYQPDADIGHFTTDQSDVFTYQLQHPNGETVQAELTVTIDVDGGQGASPFMMMSAFAEEADGAAPLAFGLADGDDPLAALLEGYLDEADGGHEAAAIDEAISSISDPAAAPAPEPANFLPVYEEDSMSHAPLMPL